ncbi:MAG: hypothetical protein BGO38_16280 [Cellulomonas sp. 73-145]|nr:MAG: hypothetical protein BGO38_16280 [Cellulomonas sp. 73-145]
MHPAPPGRTGLRSRAARSTQSLALRREVAGALVSVAGLHNRPVRDADGNEVGRVDDVVVHWDSGYSPLTGLIVRVGARRTWVHAQDVITIEQQQVLLRSTRFDLRDVVRRERELQLLGDVIDHQLVDVAGIRVVRASDLYLTQVYGVWRLVGWTSPSPRCCAACCRAGGAGGRAPARCSTGRASSPSACRGSRYGCVAGTPSSTGCGRRTSPTCWRAWDVPSGASCSRAWSRRRRPTPSRR